MSEKLENIADAEISAQAAAEPTAAAPAEEAAPAAPARPARRASTRRASAKAEEATEPAQESAEAAETAPQSDSAAQPDTDAVPAENAAESAVEATDTKADAEQPAAQPAAQPARPRRPRRQAAANTPAPELNYMGDHYSFVNPMAQYKEELDHIQAIIDHNTEVSRTGRGDYQFMVAMMTSNDEVRVNNDPNKLRAVHVYGVEVRSDRATYGTLRLVFTGEDFTAYSGLDRDESENDSDVLRRQRRYTNHAPMSKFQCVPIRIVYPDPDENGRVGIPSVICSRAFAMEKQQDKFFFGDEPIAKVGGHAPAYIMAVDGNGVRVECMGIETRINRGQLTARYLVTDATDFYKPGMAIDVAIRELEIDKENRTIHIRLSGIMREVQLGLVKNVSEIDVSTRPHELAQVVSITKNAYLVRLVAWGVIGIIAKEDNLSNVPLSLNDNVWMEITSTNEKYNRVRGRCYRI